MTESSQQEQFTPLQTNWWWFLLTLVAVLVFLGTHILAFVKDDWVPFWIEGSVTLLFFVFAVCNCIFYNYQVSKSLNAHELSWRAARVVLKPYILWASIAVMILSWIVAMIFYNSLWFFIAIGTTLLVFVVGFFSLRSLVQQIESTETDIL
ncbi:MAG: hypothetical protein F4227_00580 [Gammaproteobacteria bacterium]|nr:hypothetical protein [Gammaproteobacteria bacterium]MYF01508.1 hypothetical protein [Gammaproteobacteria bacterium]MYI77562.1 hypothetical protein [Gammaproteobacteria bacterium]